VTPSRREYHNAVTNPIFDLAGWEAYCENCAAFREARRVEAHDASDCTQYFDFRCNTCHSVLLTFQRLGTQGEESKPALPVTTARCPHCGEMNTFLGFEQIFAYVCKHCGQAARFLRTLGGFSFSLVGGFFFSAKTSARITSSRFPVMCLRNSRLVMVEPSLV
jgi:hypothetical protein